MKHLAQTSLKRNRNGELSNHGYELKRENYSDRGLSDDEVLLRKQKNLVNEPFHASTRTEKEIILGNLLTLFNFLNFGLAALVIIASIMEPKYFRNLAFMGVVLSNIFIGIIQEIRAKRTIDRLSILTEPKTLVIRGGVKLEIPVDEIVLDDLLFLVSGQQVSVDGAVEECDGFEVDESLLTGEAEPVLKVPGDKVLAGSFIVAGDAKVQVTEIGKNTYAAGIIRVAKTEKKQRSVIRAKLQKIIKVLTIIIIPIGILLFISKFTMKNEYLPDVIISSVAALIGMIPEGLMLLTEIAFAVSIVNLGKHKVLVQIMSAVESLARIDTLCLDKTGTLTSGKMLVKSFLPVTTNEKEEELKRIVSTCIKEQQTQNATQKAMMAYFVEPLEWKVNSKVSFSSKRKWSGVSFEGQGSYLIGAAEFILGGKELDDLKDEISKLAALGQRVILVAHSDNSFENEQELPANLEALCLIGIEDELREDARQTLKYFKEQNVELKIISGDYPQTVSSLAKRAGFENYEEWIDMSTLPEGANLSEIVTKYHIFGRVDPYQKKDLLIALQGNGHIVAMTGDGVNDVPALRRADCSIAMVSGSDAARASSDIVLLEDNISALIPSVYEGRRIINNIIRVASLFLVKTTYSALLSVFYIFIPQTYPVFPIQMTLIGVLTIGVPSFFLAIRPNKQRISGYFLELVLLRAIPAGLSAASSILLLELIRETLHLSDTETSTIALLVLGFIGFFILFKVMLPFNLLKALLFGTMVSIFLFIVIFFNELYFIEPMISDLALVYLPLMGLSVLLILIFEKLGKSKGFQKLRKWIFRRNEEQS
ncbi:MAG: HAD-IC family P-type ATPase [Clostridiaceae bacterium]